MSRSFGVKILLPMDQYNSDEVYAADERLEKVSSDKEDGKYYKTLKIRSTYAATTDIKAYLMGKHGLSEEDFRNYSASYRFGYCNYHFGNGKEIVLTDAEYESLNRNMWTKTLTAWFSDTFLRMYTAQSCMNCLEMTKQ